MSDCDKFKMHFSGYLDGDLTPTLRKELESHLSACVECNETFRQIKMIQQSLRELPQINTSVDFEQRLHRQLSSLSRSSSFFPQPWQNWKLPAMGSALVLATVGMFLIFNHSIEPTQAPFPNQAATQFSGAKQSPQLEASSGVSQDYESKTLITGDSLSNDSVQIKEDGMKLVGEQQ